MCSLRVSRRVQEENFIPVCSLLHNIGLHSLFIDLNTLLSFGLSRSTEPLGYAC